ncbi:GL18357 [Drosophila persimilis]|uniref:GL18357 n=1 Tax=Drosophila persimilis TaxID=7234 RepID=B4HCP6_DROPE|nr:GL18357 [Drosophila persimilis]
MVTRRQDGRLQEVGDNVNRIRRTAKGELLLELNGASKSITAKLKDIIAALGLQTGIRAVSEELCVERLLAPSLSLSEFAGTLDNLTADARGRHQVANGGDLNAWAEEWGSLATNARGRALLEIIAPLDIVLLNQGNQHTFSRAGIGSIIDLTFVSSSLFNSSRWSIYT